MLYRLNLGKPVSIALTDDNHMSLIFALSIEVLEVLVCKLAALCCIAILPLEIFELGNVDALKNVVMLKDFFCCRETKLRAWKAMF